MTKLYVFLTLAICGFSVPALAAQTIVCTNGDSASINLVRGSQTVIAPTRVDVSVDINNWSTDPNAASGHQVTVGQAFEGDDRMLIDLTDAATGSVEVKLRLFEAGADSGGVAGGRVGGGTLWVKGAGAFAVTCTGL